MKLVSISARNFKGQTFTEKLAPITVFGGGNFVGKTARLDAIRLLILGHLPELGARPRDTFGLSSGTEMTVEGEFAWGMNSKTSILKRVWRAEGNSIKSITDGDQALIDTIEEAGTLDVMLDASTYFALSDRERVKYVFKHSKVPGDWTAPVVIARMTRLLVEAGMKTAIISRVVEAVNTNIKAAKLGETDIQEALEVMLAAVEGVEKGEKDFAGRMEQTVQGLAALRSADEKTDVTDASLADQEDRHRAKADTAREELATLKARFDVLRASRTRRAEINRALGQVAAVREKLAGLRGDIADREGRLELVQAPTSDELQHARDAIREARQKKLDLVSESNRSEHAIDRLKEEREANEAKKICPYCGAAGEGWKVIRLAEINKQLADLCPAYDRLLELIAEAGKTIETAEETGNDAENRWKRRNALTAELGNLQTAAATTETALARADAMREELERLAPDDPELETAFVMRDLELKAATGEIEAITRQRQAISGRANDLRRLAEAETNRDKAREQEAAAKAAKVILRDIQAEIVEKALVPLLELANTIFGSVMKTPLAYHDGEIGTWRNSVWVGHHTFSGVEKALTYAAVQAALSTLAPVRIMLIDELARIHDDVLPEFLTMIEQAVVTGKIDGFVGIDPSRAKRWQDWNLDRSLLFKVIV